MSDSFQPFELQRMFFGEAETASLLFYAEILLRTAVMYGYTIVLARLVGKGGLGQIGPFEFVLVIAVGSATGDPMLYPEVALFHGLAVITVIILLHRATGWLLQRCRPLEKVLEGEPVLMVRDGAIVNEALRHETLSRAELLALLRQAGVRDVGTVELAYFETSGQLSVFKLPEQERRAGESTLPA